MTKKQPLRRAVLLFFEIQIWAVRLFQQEILLKLVVVRLVNIQERKRKRNLLFEVLLQLVVVRIISLYLLDSRTKNEAGIFFVAIDENMENRRCRPIF